MEGSSDMPATNTSGVTELSDGSASLPNTGSALDAENRSVAIEGATLVYRRFGNAETEAPAGLPAALPRQPITGIRCWSTASLRTAR
jgi:hypothetical protein